MSLFASAPPASASIVLGDGQDGTLVRARAGSTLTVRLTSNPSTGFTWRVVDGAPAFRLLMQRYDPPAQRGRPGVVGAPGVQTFRFRVTAAPGRTAPLKLAYNRWWKAMPLARVWTARVATVR